MQVAENGKTTQSYSYDISGQLATADYGDSKETFLWDGLALLSRNNLKYVNEPAVTGGNPILAGDKMLFDDMLGNTLGVKDGEKFSAIDRDAFGELKPGEKPNLAVNFFTGKPEIEGLGYSFLFRNYRADLGKWQTADPIGYLDGWNNFAYCRNQVVNHIDYLGAWGANVHYDLTYDAAVKAGFPKDVAEKIAQANIDTDSLFGGEGPWGAGTGDSSRHFDYNSDPTVDSRETHAQQEMAKGQHYWNTYQNEKAYEAWGRALHSLQDIDAHRDWDPREGVMGPLEWNAHPAWYDDITDPRNESAYQNTINRTNQFLTDVYNVMYE